MMQKFETLSMTGRVLVAAAGVVALFALILLIGGKGLIAMVVGAGIAVMRFLIALLPHGV